MPTRWRQLLAAGDFAAALTEAERAVNAAGRISLDPHLSSHVGSPLLLRARIHAAAGHNEPARADAAAALAQLEATLGAEHPASPEAQRLARRAARSRDRCADQESVCNALSGSVGGFRLIQSRPISLPA